MSQVSFKQMSNKKVHHKINIFTLVIEVLLVVYSLILAFLLVWALLTSFKEKTMDFGINPVGLPKKWIWSNYEMALTKFTKTVNAGDHNRKVTMAEMFYNGAIYAIGCGLVSAFTPCVVGYCCAKFKYKFSSLLYLVVIVVMIIPVVGNQAAEIGMAYSIGIYDSIPGQWLMKCAFIGINFIIFYNYFDSLPTAYNEAAKIDGANNFRIFFQIVFPLAVPIFSTVFLINFIGFWNDFQTPLLYLPTHPTIAMSMYDISNSGDPYLGSTTVKCAAAVLMLAPILVVFFSFQKKLLGNLTMGGIKG